MAMGPSCMPVAVGSGHPHRVVSPTVCSAPLVVTSELIVGRCPPQRGSVVALQRPVVQARLTSVQQDDSHISTLRSSHQTTHLENHSQSSSILRRDGIRATEAVGESNSLALIDIEDSSDGSVTFTYGAVEDLWHLDRLLEYLCGGAFGTHTAESFVPLVIELFRVPVSHSGRRRMVELLSSYIRSCRQISADLSEAEKMASQALAEAACEFLPPTNVGSYSKGLHRPYQRFSSRTDKWWKQIDNYLGVGEDAVDFLPEQSFNITSGLKTHTSKEFKERRSTRYDLNPFHERPFDVRTTDFSWLDNPAPMEWLSKPPRQLSLGPSKASSLGLVLESESSPGLEDKEYIAGLDFILFVSKVGTAEDSLPIEVEEVAPRSATDYGSFSNVVDTLPISSIQAMMQWEQEESSIPVSLSLPSRQLKEKKAMPRFKTKSSHRMPGKVNSTKSASKKKTATERRQEKELCDMFFGLPVSSKYSGVSRFLQMRKNHSSEMLVVLNQVAVGLAGAGLAVTLQVVARMLSVNPTFDSTKLVGVIRGCVLLWLSAAMQGLRKLMLNLPPGCTTSSFKDKQQLRTLQHQLRSLSFRALTVVVVTVVSHGI